MCEWIHFYVEKIEPGEPFSKTDLTALYASFEERQGIVRRTFSSAGAGLAFCASWHEWSDQHIARGVFQLYRLAVVPQKRNIFWALETKDILLHECVCVCMCTCVIIVYSYVAGNSMFFMVEGWQHNQAQTTGL